MKKTVAVICEYDPFHRGHQCQLARIRERFGADAAVIALMSGDVVQRGRPALYPKAARAEAALRCGCDLVLELPAPYSCGSAEIFADGAVSILSRLGGIDCLAFGSESDGDTLLGAARILESEAYRAKMADAPPTESYARNAERIFYELGGTMFPTEPNDILAVAYLRALDRTGAPIEPFPHRREEGFSATAAREAIRRGEDPASCLPAEAAAVLSKYTPTVSPLPAARYDAAALHTLRETPLETLSAFAGLGGGVAGLLQKQAFEAAGVEELVSAATSRIYPSARIRRAILSAVLAITPADLKRPPSFTRVLAAGPRGRAYLASIRKTAAIPIVTKPAAGRLLDGTGPDDRASRLMALLTGEPAAAAMTRGPVVENGDYLGTLF